MVYKATEYDWVWLAGLIDGEGWIGIVRADHVSTGYVQFHPVIAIQMNHEPTIRRVADIAGFGAVTSWQPSRPNTNRRYGWHAHRFNKVAQILPKIRPYLYTKREQADVLMRYVEMKVEFRKQRHGYMKTPAEVKADEENWLRLKAMNIRGLPP